MKLVVFSLLFLAVSGWSCNPEGSEEETNECYGAYGEFLEEYHY